MGTVKRADGEDGNAVFDRFAEGASQVEHDMDADRDERTDWGTSFAESGPGDPGQDTASMAQNPTVPRSEGLVDERDPREVARHEGIGQRRPVLGDEPEMESQVRDEPLRESTVDEPAPPEPVKTVTISATEYAALVAAARTRETGDVAKTGAEMARHEMRDLDHDGIPDVAEDRDGDGVPDDHDVNMGAFADRDRDRDNIPDVAEDVDGDGVPDDHDASFNGQPLPDPSTYRFVDGYNTDISGFEAEVMTPHVMDRLEVIEAEKRAEADFVNQNPVVRATPDRDLPARS